MGVESNGGWNKGLTRETDERVVRNGQAISKGLKAYYLRNNHWSKGKTKKNDKRVQNRATAMLGHRGWNKGLIKESDERVKRQSETLSKTLKIRGGPSNKGKEYSTGPRKYPKSLIHRINHSKSLKRSWGKLNREQRRKKNEKAYRAMFKAMKKRPNGLEKQFIGLIKEYGFCYKYIGDGSIWIGGLNPDFIQTNGKKNLIELFGDYWHRNDDLNERMRYFLKFGFNTLIIWEHELQNVENVVEKIRVFDRGY